jgi:hypothetical protein
VITALVLTSLAGLLALSLPRRLRRDRGPGPPPVASARAPSGEPDPPYPEPLEPAEPSGPYPESMTNELEPWEEEYLACLADELWPEDEYLDLEHSIDYEGDGDHGGGMCR